MICPDFPPSRLLLVEDDPLMLLALEQLLSKIDKISIVGTASDGLEAVNKVISLQPDVVVMDIGLPRQDGITATSQIKKQAPEVRVVMLSSHTSETEIVASLSSGADGYCVKGSSEEHLVRAIASARDGAIYLDPQIARQVMHNLRRPFVSPKNLPQLSQRELEVLKLMVEGMSNPEIAATLYLSPNTVKTHVRGIMNKLSVDDRVKAAVFALRTGLV